MRFHIYSCQINCVGMCPFSCTAVIECQFSGAVGEACARDDTIRAAGIWYLLLGWGTGGGVAEKCN